MNKPLLIILMILISSCGSVRNLPEKPSIDLCVNYLETMIAICKNNQRGDSYRLDASETNRYILMSPDHWALTLMYIRALEGYSPRKVRRELKKIRSMSKDLYGL